MPQQQRQAGGRAPFLILLSFFLLQMLIESRIAKRTPLVDVSETEFYRQTALKHPKEVS